MPAVVRLPNFTLTRATTIDGTHVRVYFSCPLEASASNTAIANFSFGGGLTTLSCVAGGDYIDIHVNEMSAGGSYTVTVNNVRDVFNRKLTGSHLLHFTGGGDSPRLVYVTAIDSRTVRIRFTEQMTINAALRSATNYTFTGDYALTTQSVTVLSSEAVELRTSAMVPKAGYFIHIVNVSDSLGNVITPRLGQTNFASTNRPVIKSAVCYDETPFRVRIEFDRDMEDNIELITPSNYYFNGPYPFYAVRVVRINYYTLDVYYTNAMNAGTYRLVVSGATDAAGREPDPFAATPFTTIGDGASLQSVTYRTPVQLWVNFSAAMLDNIALRAPTNYIFTGHSTITPQSVAVVSPTRVKLITSDIVDSTAYRLTVQVMTDIFGNPLVVDSVTFNSGIYLRPQVAGAVATSSSLITVTFNRAMANNAALLTTTNYTFVGVTTITASAVTRVNSTTVRISISGEMRTGAAYTLTIHNLVDANEVPISVSHATASFIGVGTAPQLASAVTQDYTTVRLMFSEAMLNNVDLVNPANYAVTGPTVTTAFSMLRISAAIVDMTVTGEMRNGSAYTVEAANVKDVAGNVIDPAHDSTNFIGMSALPQLVSATAQDSDTIRLVFDKPMENNAALTNIANYVFIGDTALTPTLVTRINATTVDVDTNEMKNAGSYTVTVSNVTDLVGNVIDPAHDQAVFSGIGIAPQVVSATPVIGVQPIDVVFDSAMEQTSMETATNYTISGDGAPVVTAAAKQSDTTVRLTIPTATAGNFVVTVANVTDAAGNVIDPAHNSASYTAGYRIPDISTHATLLTDLVGYWTLDDSGFTDSSGNGFDGTFYNSPTFPVAKLRTGAQLNGTTQYGDITGTSLSFQGDFSVSFWFKANTWVEDALLARVGSDWTGPAFSILQTTAGGNKLKVRIWQGVGQAWATTTSTFVAGQWYHIVFRRQHVGIGDASGYWVYINGVVDPGINNAVWFDNTFTVGNGQINVGWFPDTQAPLCVHFDGILDELGVWNKLVSVGEIADLYNGFVGLTWDGFFSSILTHPTLRGGLIAHYKLDGDGSDSLGVLNGTLEGAPTFVAGKIGTALQGDGSSKCVDLGDSLQLAPIREMSVACWYYATTVAGNYAIVSRSTNMVATMAWTLVTVGGNISWWITNAAGSFVNCQVGGVSTGAWQNFVATYDASNLRVYKNSVLIGGPTPQTGDQRRIAGQHALIGAQCSAGLNDRGLYNPNIIDEVVIWDRALAQTEATDLYQSGNGLAY